eukprot:6206437-Pleurochrysis_carterae.AAC.1
MAFKFHRPYGRCGTAATHEAEAGWHTRKRRGGDLAGVVTQTCAPFTREEELYGALSTSSHYDHLRVRMRPVV